MSKPLNPTAAHIQRLQRMADRIRHDEAEMQAKHGDRSPGSARASNMLDLIALDRVLAWLKAGG